MRILSTRPFGLSHRHIFPPYNINSFKAYYIHGTCFTLFLFPHRSPLYVAVIYTK